MEQNQKNEKIALIQQKQDQYLNSGSIMQKIDKIVVNNHDVSLMEQGTSVMEKLEKSWHADGTINES